MGSRLAYLAFASFALAAFPVIAQQPPDRRPIKEVTQQWQIGVRIHAAGGAVSGIRAAMPFPLEWPEQDVRVIGVEQTDNVRRVSYRSLGDGAQQMVVEISRLQTGESASVIATVELRRRVIEPPRAVEQWKIPRRIDKELKPYILPSPYIESRDRLIRQTARRLLDVAPTPDWARIESIYDWVRGQVRYEFDPKIRSCVEALKAGRGDCEELTSLFIALCRAQQIPARAVWVPGHCYPEFYLENEQGEGRWFPCQAAGTKLFGEMIEWRPILQKGDRFKVPGKKGWQRYVSESLTAKSAAGAPKVEFIRKPLGDAVATRIGP